MISENVSILTSDGVTNLNVQIDVPASGKALVH